MRLHLERGPKSVSVDKCVRVAEKQTCNSGWRDPALSQGLPHGPGWSAPANPSALPAQRSLGPRGQAGETKQLRLPLPHLVSCPAPNKAAWVPALSLKSRRARGRTEKERKGAGRGEDTDQAELPKAGTRADKL